MYTGHKIVLLGDSGVGKSSLMSYLITGHPENQNCPTIGAAFYSKDFNIDDKKIKFNIWDTAGQERFRSVTKLYYRNTAGCLVVFDITNHNSFVSIKKWIDDYLNENNGVKNIIIIANKTDINKKNWEIDESEIKGLSDEYGYPCLYTSCITGSNVEEAFVMMGKMVLEGKIDNKKEYDTLSINYQKSSGENCARCG